MRSSVNIMESAKTDEDLLGGVTERLLLMELQRQQPHHRWSSNTSASMVYRCNGKAALIWPAEVSRSQYFGPLSIRTSKSATYWADILHNLSWFFLSRFLTFYFLFSYF